MLQQKESQERSWYVSFTGHVNAAENVDLVAFCRMPQLPNTLHAQDIEVADTAAAVQLSVEIQARLLCLSRPLPLLRLDVYRLSILNINNNDDDDDDDNNNNNNNDNDADQRHAFQSLLWNLAASERIKLYGRDAAVEGDLVFPRDSPAAVIEDDATLVDPAIGAAAVDAAEGDGDGEDEGGEGQQPEAKRAKTAGTSLPPVHVVTKEDVEEGTFRLTDVVLPMPG